MRSGDKPLIWLHGEVKTPPLSSDARINAGYLLRQLQQGVRLNMPESRPMSTIGRRVHELRIDDTHSDCIWRIIYRIDDDAIVIAEVFNKKTQQTPKYVIDNCKDRFRRYGNACR